MNDFELLSRDHPPRSKRIAAPISVYGFSNYSRIVSGVAKGQASKEELSFSVVVIAKTLVAVVAVVNSENVGVHGHGGIKKGCVTRLRGGEEGIIAAFA